MEGGHFAEMGTHGRISIPAGHCTQALLAFHHSIAALLDSQASQFTKDQPFTTAEPGSFHVGRSNVLKKAIMFFRLIANKQRVADFQLVFQMNLGVDRGFLRLVWCRASARVCLCACNSICPHTGPTHRTASYSKENRIEWWKSGAGGPCMQMPKQGWQRQIQRPDLPTHWKSQQYATASFLQVQAYQPNVSWIINLQIHVLLGHCAWNHAPLDTICRCTCLLAPVFHREGQICRSNLNQRLLALSVRPCDVLVRQWQTCRVVSQMQSAVVCKRPWCLHESRQQPHKHRWKPRPRPEKNGRQELAKVGARLCCQFSGPAVPM